MSSTPGSFPSAAANPIFDLRDYWADVLRVAATVADELAGRLPVILAIRQIEDAFWAVLPNQAVGPWAARQLRTRRVRPERDVYRQRWECFQEFDDAVVAKNPTW